MFGYNLAHRACRKLVALWRHCIEIIDGVYVSPEAKSEIESGVDYTTTRVHYTRTCRAQASSIGNEFFPKIRMWVTVSAWFIFLWTTPCVITRFFGVFFNLNFTDFLEFRSNIYNLMKCANLGKVFFHNFFKLTTHNHRKLHYFWGTAFQAGQLMAVRTA